MRWGLGAVPLPEIFLTSLRMVHFGVYFDTISQFTRPIAFVEVREEKGKLLYSLC